MAPKPLKDGLLWDLGTQRVKVVVYDADIIRVVASSSPDAAVRPSLTALPSRAKPLWTWRTDGPDTVISTSAVQVRVDNATGRVRFFDHEGRPVLAECAGVARLTPAAVQGENTWHVAERWEPHDDEGFFGLGQNQYGIGDIKGFDMDLWQHNTSIAVPFLVSTRGYGILWDNTSETRWGDLRPFVAPPADVWCDRDGKAGGLTATYFASRDFTKPVATQRDSGIDIRLPDRNDGANAKLNAALPTGDASVRWEGSLVPSQTGDYQFDAYFDGDFKLWVDGKLLINHWRQDWLAADDLARVRLEAGRKYALRMEWIRDRNSTSLSLKWKTPSPEPATALWSEVGDGVDYYFVYGPSPEAVIGGYRRVTGRATMLPRWAYGLWQSRERYETQQASLDVVNEYRRRGIPFDNIVQDWQYWRTDQWGSHEFDPTRFPDPAGWVQAIHRQHAQLMISVWAKFYAGTDNYRQLLHAGCLYPLNIEQHQVDFLGYPFSFLDAYNPTARRMFWTMMKHHLVSLGIDAWWMDASEPDMTSRPELGDQKAHLNPNYLGTGARMLLPYPVVLARTVYEGLRQEFPDRRVFNLTRSGYLGLQHFGAASWSGDITSTWTAMRKQIAAGISYCASGLPYWTMDCGGFSVPARFDPAFTAKPDVDEWREMNARWFEFATFVPLLRLHGQRPCREMWCFGDAGSPAYDAMLASDQLRYRLLPYIYSLAGSVVRRNTLMIEPVAFAYPQDAQARELADEFMFGPALLVSPVTEYRARSRSVYLPPTAGGWYDLWSGEWLGAGGRREAAAPYEHIPVAVPAGSILPTGPAVQYALEKPSDPVVLRVYAGRDGAFTLYEDDGVSNGYERGAYSEIGIKWEDATRTLVIGKRKGAFPGMLAQRTFRVVVIDPKKAEPLVFDPHPDAEISYDGNAVEHKM